MTDTGGRLAAAGLARIATLAAIAAIAVGCGGSSSAGKPDARSDGGPFPVDGAGSGGSASGSGGATGSGGAATGSGGSASGSGGAGGFGGQDASAGSDAAGTDVSTACVVRLTPLSVSSFVEEIEAGAMALFRVRADVVNRGPREPRWTWRVTDADSQPVPTAPVGGDPATVEFAIKTVGSYVIGVELDSGVTCASASGIARVIAPRPASFIVRSFPPEAMGLPAQDTRISLTGNTFAPSNLALLPGVSVTVAPYQADVRLPAYVRISSAASRVAIEGHTGPRPVSAVLLPFVTYDLLLIPDGPVAPLLLSKIPAEIRSVVPLDPGIAVTGRTLGPGGQPIGDVRVVMRAGTRPSTLGRSDASGAFELLTRGGTMSAEINPPDGSSLPNLRVPGTPGIVLTEGGSLELSVTWAPATTAALRISVVATDGTTPVAGAAVLVESTAPPGGPAAGQVTAKLTGSFGPTEVVLPAEGAVKVEATSSATGAATFPALPVGAYRVTVAPPPAMAAAQLATSTAMVTLPGAGITRAIPLVRKVRMSGTLSPAAMTSGVRVIAIDELTRASTAVTAGDGGRYQLLLDPGRSYRMWVEPPAGQLLGRAVLGTITAGVSDGAVPDRTVPPGLPFDGRVAVGATPAGGTLIQVFCVGLTTHCVDPTLPLAETIAAPDGTFYLVLPDPGIRN